MITIYFIDVVTIAPNLQTFMKIFLSVMQVITIYLTNISIRKEKTRKNDASFLSQSVPSLSGMQFVSDFLNSVIFNSVYILLNLRVFTDILCPLLC